jgi:hypothetical protein
LSRYKKLLAELRAATSNAEDDDVAVLQELDTMKMWIAQEFVITAGARLTYEVNTGH